MNTQRRIFRGRGGPTDGRLPKHNARRRKQPPKQASAGNKYNNYGECGNDPVTVHVPEHDMEEEIVEQVTTPPDEPWRKEIQHLQRRMRSVQASIQTGTQGIANPKIYQENVLNAVQNCIQEWRAILKHYEIIREPAEEDEVDHDDDDNYDDGRQTDDDFKSQGERDAVEEEEEEEEDDFVSMTTAPRPMANTTIDPEITKATALQVYMLLQLSVQCGPLAAGKPGYFKRCGSTVAQMVEDHLNQVNDDDCCRRLRFSQKQANAIESWHRAARKAAASSSPKEPSKTALKKQTGKSKKKKMKK